METACWWVAASGIGKGSVGGTVTASAAEGGTVAFWFGGRYLVHWKAPARRDLFGQGYCPLEESWLQIFLLSCAWRSVMPRHQSARNKERPWPRPGSAITRRTSVGRRSWPTILRRPSRPR